MSTLTRISTNKALFGTIEGKIGKVTIIDEVNYLVLKKAERKTIIWLREECLGYTDWRKRM